MSLAKRACLVLGIAMLASVIVSPAAFSSSGGQFASPATPLSREVEGSGLFTIDTQYVVDLAVKLDVDPQEVLKAYGLGARYGVGVEAVIHLRARGTVDWTKVEEFLAKLKEVRRAIGAFAQGSPTRLERLAEVASAAYGVSANDLRVLCTAGLSEDEILTLLFLLGAPKPVETRESAGRVLSCVVTELGKARVPDIRGQLSQMCEALQLRGLAKGIEPREDPSVSMVGERSQSADAIWSSPITPPLSGGPERTPPAGGVRRITPRTAEEEPGDEGGEKGVPSIVDPSSAYNSERVLPFKDHFSGIVETIDPSSGGLIVKQRDLVLPGRNGLDLVIERVYISQTAYAYTPGIQVTITRREEYGSEVTYATVKSTLTSPTHLERIHGMGCGWSWNFPSVEAAGSGSKYLHMGDGTVYKVNFNTLSHLDKYPLQDMVFDNDSGTYSNGSWSSAYVLKFKDGRSVYFASSGQTIGIKDRYNNEIRFNYVQIGSDWRLQSIKDSVGRVVSFDYGTPGQVRMTTGGKTWLYSLSPTGIGNSRKLETVTDPVNRVTAYAYEVRGASFHGSVDSADHQTIYPATNYYVNLTQLTHPTQGTTRFVYGEAHKDFNRDDPAVNDGSDLTYFRVLERADYLDAAAATNRSRFTYVAYDSATQTYRTVREELKHVSDASASPAREEWVYGRDHLLKVHRIGTSDMAEAVERSYEYYAYKVPSTETTKFIKGTTVRTSTVSYKWDSYKDLMEERDSLGRRTEFEYELPYHLPVHKSEFLETVNSVEYYRHTSYTLDEAKRNVTKETALVGYLGEGPTVTYTGPTSPSMYTGREWVWTPGKRIHSATIKTSWFAAWPGQPVDYTVYYRPVGTTTWTYYANHHHGSYLFSSASGTCTFNISLSPGYYEFRVYVGYTGAFGSSVRVSSAQVTGRELMWLPRGITSTIEYGYSTSYPGNMTQVTFRHPDGSTESTGFTYDSQYNAYPITSSTTVQKADGSTSTITTFASYDFFGRTTEYGTRDQTTSSSNRYTYDSVGRLVQATYPAVGGVTSSKTWAYDDVSRTVTVRDENQNTLTEVYDPLGRFVELRRPLGGVVKSVEKAFYNSLGGLSAVEDAEGHRTSYNYDAFRRKTGVTYADGAVHAFEYGVLASDPDGAIRYEKAIDSNANWTRRGYDAAGRLVKVEELVAQSPETVATTRYRYDLLDRLVQVTDAVGQVTTYGYDLWDNPTSADLPGTTEPVHTYTYDARGRRISEDAGDPALYTQYRYDALGRLTRTIDKVGNRLSEAWDGGVPKSYAYSPGNYLASAGNATYGYGKYGRLTRKQASGTTTEYLYNGARRLAQVKVGGTETARYVYDAFGRRISATSGGTTRVSLYLGNDIVYETDGVKVTKYIVASGRHLAKVVTHTGIGDPPLPQGQYGTFYFHTDLVGSIRAVTDSSGEVVARYEYEPFGLTVTAEGTLAGLDVHKFTGKPEDAETGLYYFGARLYDPEVGRFMSPDPLGEGPNPYAYCALNPLRYVDPSGMAAEAGAGGGGWPEEEWNQVLDALRENATAAVEASETGVSSWLRSLNLDFMSFWDNTWEPFVRIQQTGLDLGLLAAVAGPVMVHDSGKQHGSPEHWAKITSLVAALKARPDVTEIWVNRAVSTVTEGLVKCTKRPDIVYSTVDGLLRFAEVVSKTQIPATMKAKLERIVLQVAIAGLKVAHEVEVHSP
ncbi:MAG: hypothetical protein NUW12_12060 [Firmicutes bacterium]|jgi:RHS repeat-associated protein|nr:hypothetical protein [Bacillota bacterium]